MTVTYFASFLAGLLSFVSPCVLPLIPGYVSFVSGLSLDEMREVSAGRAAEARRHVLVASIAFVFGFSLVFIALGASASVVGDFIGRRLPVLGKIAGAIIIILGLHTAGVFRIKWLEFEKRVQTRQKPTGLIGAALVGIAFAFGWTPCIGPILGGILVIAGRQDSVTEGVKLLAVYSAGLGIPFVATSVAVNRFFSASARIRRHFKTIEIVSGLLLIGIGILILTDQFSAIARFLQRYLPTY